MSQAPSPGRIVLYKLSVGDAQFIAQQRQDAPSLPYRSNGNVAVAGDEYPAVVVRTFGESPTGICNLKVLLDGPDTYWATSRMNIDSDYCRNRVGTDWPNGQGCWRWPVTVPPQSPATLIRGSVTLDEKPVGVLSTDMPLPPGTVVTMTTPQRGSAVTTQEAAGQST